MRERVSGTGGRQRIAWLVLCAVVVCTGPAQAAPDGNEPRPWAAGVSETEQAIALEIYVSGNSQFTESHLVEALAKYREALRHWDHPAIRFNIAVCLIKLGEPVEARENLERSLAHGASALGSDAYLQADTYRTLLDALVVRVAVASSEAGAEITLDGKLLFIGPGSGRAFVSAGEHYLVATKPGQFVTTSRTFTAAAGDRLELEIQPRRLLVGGYPATSRTPVAIPTPKLKSEPWNAKDVAIRLKSSGPLIPVSLAARPTPPTSSLSAQSAATPALSTLARGFDGPQLRPPTPPPSLAGRIGSASTPIAGIRTWSATGGSKSPAVRLSAPPASATSRPPSHAGGAPASAAPSTYRAPPAPRSPR